MSDFAKAELHAHLSGSIPRKLIKDILHRRGELTKAKEAYLAQPPTSLKECFDYFSLVHQTIQSQATLEEVATAVMESFASQGVTYLELRTSPKNLPDGTTPEEYLDRVIQLSSPQGMEVKWLISIDRARGLNYAQQIKSLALNNKNNPNLVGIDFSGHPAKGHFRDFIPILEQLRQEGLGLTVHCAETPECHDTDDILDFSPDRLGHAVWLNKAQERIVLEKAIPIEVCYTSNLIAAGTHHDHHPVSHWFAQEHPFIICTDDQGLFDSPIHKEYQLVEKHLDTSLEAMHDIATRGFQYGFQS